MPKKNLFNLSRDARGNYRRQNLGKTWKDGDWKDQTFYLGRDYGEACKRVLGLEKLWSAVVEDWQKFKLTPCPCWTEQTLGVAFAVSKGEDEVTLTVPADVSDAAAQIEDSEDRERFVGMWFRAQQTTFPFIKLRLDDPQQEENVTAAATRLGEEFKESALKIAANLQAKPSGGMLRAALQGFLGHLRRKYIGTEYGKTYGNQVVFLHDNSEDIPLSALTTDKLTEWQEHYRRRPSGKRGQLSHRYCVNLIKTIRDFVRWLDASEEFQWQLPRGYRFARIKVEHTSEELSARMHTENVKRYTVEELATLWEYALPNERALIVLGLNCGFARAEIVTLMQGEIFIDHEHPKFKVTANWIKRLRRKTKAYGEWILWPESVAAIKWVQANRPASSAKNLFINQNGRPLDEATTGGNRNQQIGNMWQRLLDRVRKDKPDFKALAVKYLRKTGASMIRHIAGGETASVYMSHGPACDTEDKLLAVYTNRPFGKMHKALRKLRRKLEPVFSCVTDPFPEDTRERRPQVSLGTIKRIKELHASGKTVAEIAEMTKTSKTTVRRYTAG